MMENKINFYKAEISSRYEVVAKLKSKANIISWLRLCFFIGFVIGTYLSFSNTSYFLILGSLSLVLFLILLKNHLKIEFEREVIKHQLEILQTELLALNGEPGFWLDGNEFHEPKSYSNDLDIFGKYSLFHFINRTSTENSAKKLANDLLQTDLEKENILEKQKSIAEFSQNFEFRIKWQSLGMMMESKRDMRKSFAEKLSFPIEFKNYKWLIPVLILLPLIVFSATGYYIISGIYQPLMYAVVFNLFFVGIFLKKILLRQRAVDGTKKILLAYVKQIELFEAQQWESNINLQFKKDLKESHQALNELTNISEWFDRRMNVFVGILFNAYILYDFYCVLRLEKWILKYNHHYNSWFETLSEIDAKQSLGTFAFNHPNFNLPVISNGNEIIGESIGHPLIEESKNICNDFKIAHPEKLVLITGSNMSGKSTFLRTLGVTLVMANVGLPVNAKRFVFKPMLLCTSLKQTDNLHENVSLFHAELLRLQSIREQLDKKIITLVLIDEMLRGTNSEDKLYGSGQLMEELTHENIFGLIASHDLELGKLEQKYPGIIRNACFESVIENNELSFDYKLKKGIARNKNASFLMKRMQVIRSKDKIN